MKKRILSLALALVMVMAVLGLSACNRDPNAKPYTKAVELMDAGKYQEAIDAFKKLKDYSTYEDVSTRIKTCTDEISYNKGEYYLSNGDFETAKGIFESLGDFKDSKEQVTLCEDAILALKVNDAADKVSDAIKGAGEAIGGIIDIFKK